MHKPPDNPDSLSDHFRLLLQSLLSHRNLGNSASPIHPTTAPTTTPTPTPLSSPEIPNPPAAAAPTPISKPTLFGVSAYCRNPSNGKLAQWIDEPRAIMSTDQMDILVHLATLEAEREFGKWFRGPVMLLITNPNPPKANPPPGPPTFTYTPSPGGRGPGAAA